MFAFRCRIFNLVCLDSGSWGRKKKENGLSKCWTVVKRTVVYVESINEIIKIDRSNETFLALLSCGAALFSLF